MLKEAETEKDVAFQGCSLDEPGGPWGPTFGLGRILSVLSHKSRAGHP